MERQGPDQGAAEDPPPTAAPVAKRATSPATGGGGRRLRQRSLASIADQGATAALAFAASVFVGRRLGAEALGLLAMTGVLVMILRQLQAATILEPMAVFGARRRPAERGPYLGFALALQGVGGGGLTALLALLTLAAVAAGVVGDAAAGAIWGALIFANAATLLNLIRRQCYVDERPQRALAQSASVLLLTLAGFAVAGWTGGLSLFGVYLVMTVAALVVAAVQWPAVARGLARPTAAQRQRFAAEHRRFGGWSLATVPLAIAGYQGFFLLAGWLVAADASGRLKAAETLVAPFAQAAIGLGLMFVPHVARRLGAADAAGTDAAAVDRRVIRPLALALALAALAYAALVLVFGQSLLRLLFGAGFDGGGALAGILAALPLAIAAALPATVLLAAHRRADLRFAATAAATLGGLGIGVPLILAFGAAGTAAALVLTQTLLAAALWAAYGLHRRRPAAEGG